MESRRTQHVLIAVHLSQNRLQAFYEANHLNPNAFGFLAPLKVNGFERTDFSLKLLDYQSIHIQ